MAFRVRQTEQADRDLDAILRWLIDRQSGDQGLRWFNGLLQIPESLRESPYLCAFAPEDSQFPFEVRQLLYGRRPHVYRILFTVEDDVVVILHIRHGRRSRATRLPVE